MRPQNVKWELSTPILRVRVSLRVKRSTALFFFCSVVCELWENYSNIDWAFSVWVWRLPFWNKKPALQTRHEFERHGHIPGQQSQQKMLLGCIMGTWMYCFWSFSQIWDEKSRFFSYFSPMFTVLIHHVVMPTFASYSASKHKVQLRSMGVSLVCIWFEVG